MLLWTESSRISKGRSEKVIIPNYGESCKYNVGVACEYGRTAKCNTCGWNPKVSNCRREKLAEEREKNAEKENLLMRF